MSQRIHFSRSSNLEQFISAAPYTLLIASLIVLIFGPGRVSADAFLEGRNTDREVDGSVAGPSAAQTGSARVCERARDN
jgi:hypothetical protein